MIRSLAALVLFVIASSATAATVPIDCFRKAQDQLRVSDETASHLCAAAPDTDSPLRCFREAQDQLKTSDASSSVLCAGVRSRSASLGCFRLAQDQMKVSDETASRLCGGTAKTAGPVDCFRRAQEVLKVSDETGSRLCRGADEGGAVTPAPASSTYTFSEVIYGDYVPFTRFNQNDPTTKAQAIANFDTRCRAWKEEKKRELGDKLLSADCGSREDRKIGPYEIVTPHHGGLTYVYYRIGHQSTSQATVTVRVKGEVQSLDRDVRGDRLQYASGDLRGTQAIFTASLVSYGRTCETWKEELRASPLGKHLVFATCARDISTLWGQPAGASGAFEFHTYGRAYYIEPASPR